MPPLNTRKRPIAEINIVPYVDVMLVLLVIFMVAAPMLMQGVEVELPEATAKSIQSVQEEPIVMSVDDQGQYFLNIAPESDKPLDAVSIAQQVKAALTQDPKRAVLVKGDNKVAYGTVVAAMVILQQAGAPSVGLLTRSPEQE